MALRWAIVVFFNRELAREFDYRCKQAGHLASKMRFLSAPWTALLANDVWLKERPALQRNGAPARRKTARRGLGTGFPARGKRALRVHLPDRHCGAAAGRAGGNSTNSVEPDVYRLMCSWSTTTQDIEDFVTDFRSSPGESTPESGAKGHTKIDIQDRCEVARPESVRGSG